LIAATFTALRDDGSINVRTVEVQAQALVEQGLRGAFVCGTTGEGASLTTAERMDVAERWCAVARDNLEIIVHVGHTSLSEARALAAHAQRAGAAAIAAVAPFYYKPRDVAELVDVCAEVAEAAPRVPFYYYHIPSMTGVDLPMADFFLAAKERIRTLAGIKFTHEDLADYGRCLDLADGRYEIFFGRDEMLLAGLSLGARSAVGSTYNFAAPLYQRIFDAFERGDTAAAREAQIIAREMIRIAAKYGGLPALKAMMGQIGIECGPCRLPLRTLAPDRRERLREECERIGFYRKANKGPEGGFSR
jgi:N-acetylneuraminate lyase